MEQLFAPTPTNRFLTTFVFGGIPSPLDIAFQRITGLSRELSVTEFTQGGDNRKTHHLADRVRNGTLTLERGIVTATPLAFVFDEVLRGERMVYADVVILLLNHRWLPVCSWILSDALPVGWQTGALDANANSVAINTLTLRYESMRWLGIKA